MMRFTMGTLALALVGGLAATASAKPVPAGAAAAALRQDRDNPVEERMTAALNLMEADGFGAFSDFHAAGKNYAALVDQDGRRFPITVDPDSGEVARGR